MTTRTPVILTVGALLMVLATALVTETGVSSAGASPAEPSGAPATAAAPDERPAVRRAPVVVVDAVPCLLSGRVVDSVGAPVVGVAARVTGSSAGPAPGEQVASTDDDGAFVWQGRLALPQELSVTIEHSGYVPLHASVRCAVAGEYDVGELVLHPGFAIDLEVVDEDGAPVPGAGIRWCSPGITPPLEVTADASGRATLPHVPPGAYEVEGSAPSFFPAVLAGHLPFSEPRDTVLQLVLKRARALSGRVVDADGEPLVGASLVARRDEVERAATSRASGSFRFDALCAGAWEIEARAPGHRRAWRQLDPATDDGVEIRMARPFGITGKVTLESQPVERFAVALKPVVVGGAARGVERVDRLDRLRALDAPRPGGSFRFDDLEAGAYTVTVLARGAQPWQSAPILLDDEDDAKGKDEGGKDEDRRDEDVRDNEPEPLLVELQPGLTCAGRVVTRQDGAAIAGATVELHRASPSEQPAVPGGSLRWFHAQASRETRGGPLCDVTASGADGAFAFEGLPAGSYYVRVTHPDHTGHESLPRPAAVSDQLEVELGPASRIHGTVAGVKLGEAVAVFAWPGRGPALRAAVDRSGRYALDGVEPGIYALAVLADAGGAIRSRIAARMMTKPRVLRVHDRGGDWRFDLAWAEEPRAELRGSLHIDGRVAIGQPVSVSRSLGGTVEKVATTRVQRGGQFTFAGLPVGDYWLTVGGDDHLFYRAWTRVHPRSPMEPRISVRSARVVVQVPGLGAAAGELTAHYLQRQTHPGAASAVAQRHDESFVLPWLARGAWELELRRPGRETVWKRVEVEDGEQTVVWTVRSGLGRARR